MSQYGTTAELAYHGTTAVALTAFTTAEQTAALVAASAEADAELNRRYALPLASWGDDLRRAVCAIAAYELLGGRGFDSPNEGSTLRQRALDARAWLKRVGDGSLDPPSIVDDSDDEGVREGGPNFITDPKRGW